VTELKAVEAAGLPSRRKQSRPKKRKPSRLPVRPFQCKKKYDHSPSGTCAASNRYFSNILGEDMIALWKGKSLFTGALVLQPLFTGLIEIGNLGLRAWRSRTSRRPLASQQTPVDGETSSHSLLRGLMLLCALYQLFVWLHSSW
jgi:hypothetical protein